MAKVQFEQKEIKRWNEQHFVQKKNRYAAGLKM